MRQWEHLVVSSAGAAASASQSELNRLGAEGWEVVGVADVTAKRRDVDAPQTLPPST